MNILAGCRDNEQGKAIGPQDQSDRRVSRLGLALGFTLALTALSGAAGVGTTVRYQIDVDAHPGSLGEVTQSTTTPGQFLSIVHPLGKGDASGSADYGLLRARARLDPDFPTDQLSTASAETYFDDVLTIYGSNLGDTATAVVSLRTIGSIRQPFYVSEVTGIASASADLLASSSVEGASDTRSFGPAGREPIFVNYDASLTAIIRFVVGDPVTIQAALRAGSEANLNVPPEYDDFTADFLSAATLQPILLIGVTNPTVSSESGHIYPLGTTTAAPELPPLPALALSAPGPNPFRGSTTATLTLPNSASVRAGIIDVAGRQVRHLLTRTLPAGPQELNWDGRDDSGRPASAGVYFLVVESGAAVDAEGDVAEVAASLGTGAVTAAIASPFDRRFPATAAGHSPLRQVSDPMHDVPRNLRWRGVGSERTTPARARQAAIFLTDISDRAAPPFFIFPPHEPRRYCPRLSPLHGVGPSRPPSSVLEVAGLPPAPWASQIAL